MTNRHSNHGLRKVCGCPRRAWPKCPHAWHLNFKPRGGPSYRLSLDKHLGKHIERKSDAEDIAASIRTAIKAGKFGQPTAREDMTLRQLADTYLERYVAVERSHTQQAYTWGLSAICTTVVPRPTGGSAPLGDWRLTDLVTDTVERFRETRRGQGTGVVGVNRQLGLLRALFNWAVRVGYVETSPFKRGSEPVVKLSQEPSRSRRLHADEEGPLLAACGSHLRAIVEAALETGMRRGEILSLQWREVSGITVDGTTVHWAPRAELVLSAAKTKTKRDRRIPISTRLKAILEIRRLDPAGKPHPADAYVFGNVIGQPVRNIKRAWTHAVLKAHGHTPTYTTTANLAPASRTALAEIDLHFHDLRREAGSRWLEGWVPLHTVRDWLGHTNISQTSTYLAGTQQTQHDTMRQYEERHAALAAAAKAKAEASVPSVQECATEVETGGRKQPRAAVSRDRKPSKTAGGRQTAIM